MTVRRLGRNSRRRIGWLLVLFRCDWQSARFWLLLWWYSASTTELVDFGRRRDVGACAVEEIINIKLWMRNCIVSAFVALCEWTVQSNESCIHVVMRFDQKFSRHKICVGCLCCVCVHFCRSVVSIECTPARAKRGIWLFSGFPPFWYQSMVTLSENLVLATDGRRGWALEAMSSSSSEEVPVEIVTQENREPNLVGRFDFFSVQNGP
jgi:hypothetical protein